MSPNWEFRHYSFDSKWSATERLASIRNGSGDDLYALFNSTGCFIKGFAHEAPMTPYRVHPPEAWPGIFDGIPREYAACLDEPAFTISDVTFCIWRNYSDAHWSRGNVEFPPEDDPDGSEFLLKSLDADPVSYCHFAEDYYETSIPLDSVRHIYDRLPLSDEIIASLNSAITLTEILEDLLNIGY